MKKNNFGFKSWCVAALSSFILLTSCNKDLENFATIPTPVYPSGTTMGRTIASNPNDSLWYRMLLRSGLVNQFNDSTRTFTVFAVDNAGMKVFVNAATGGFIPLSAPDVDFSRFLSGTYPVPPVNLSQTSAAGIISYNTIGQLYPFAKFGSAFPNMPLPSLIQLDPINTPFLRMTICPSNSSPFKYVNNIPATGQIDQAVSNGMLHHTFTVVAPPTTLLKGLIANKANLTYFRAAIQRADSGQAPGTGRLDSLLNFGALNMTVLAPSDAAFQTLVFGLAFGAATAQGAPPALATTIANGAVAAGPAFLGTNNITTAQVRGIIAYHFLATRPSATASFSPNVRVFTPNVPSTPTLVTTLVNGSIAAHPGIRALATFTGPTATTVSFTGLGTFPPGGAAFSGTAATVIDRDNHAVNGVFHIIDRVLLPQ